MLLDYGSNEIDKDFQALLSEIGDYYYSSWWVWNRDHSATFFDFLDTGGPIPTYPTLFCYNEHSLSEVKQIIKERSAGNLAYDDFKSIEPLQLNDTFGDDTDPKLLTLQECKKLINIRLSNMSKFDRRREYLFTAMKDPKTDQRRELSVEMLQERIIYDNLVISFRKGNTLNQQIPESDYDDRVEAKWFLYNDLERKVLESSDVKQFQFSQFKEKRLSKVDIMINEVACGKGSLMRYMIQILNLGRLLTLKRS